MGERKMANGKLDETAKGVYAISATPFTDDGAVDSASTDRMVDFYLESGVTGLTILGVMGEAPKMSPEESSDFCRQVLERIDGRVPVVVGVSAPGLSAIESLTARVMDLGAAGVMVSPMAGLRTDEAIENYFRMVCEALGDAPIVLQDYPPASGVYMSVPLLNKLFAEFRSLKVLKHEDWPGLRKISKFRTAEKSGAHRRISILVGNGALFLPLELQRGVDGGMTGFAFPDMLVRVCEMHAAGDVDGAHDLFDAYLPLVRYEQQIGMGLAIRKETMRRRGVIASAKARAPGPAMDSDDHAELDCLIDRLKRRLGELGLEPPEI